MDLRVAETILGQLGGGRFVAMTGAHSISAGDNFLRLRFRGSRRVNYLRVSLTPDDTYDVEFAQVGKSAVRNRAQIEGVYAEQLQEIFRRYTGLDTAM